MTHQILWLALREQVANTGYWRGRLGVKGKDKSKWPKFPWSKDSDNGQRHGKVREADKPAAIEYLLSLSAPPTHKED